MPKVREVYVPASTREARQAPAKENLIPQTIYGGRYVVTLTKRGYNEVSRSYKKTPGHCDRSPFHKRQANKRIRSKPVSYPIANGNSYKKEFCSYDICDFKFIFFFNTSNKAAILDEIQKWPWRPTYDEAVTQMHQMWSK